MNSKKNNLNCYPRESLVLKTAQYIIELMREMVANNVSSVLFLSGGSLMEVYTEIAKIMDPDINLRGLVVVLVDERDVEYGSAGSNEQKLGESEFIFELEKRGGRFVGILPKDFVEESSSKKDKFEMAKRTYKSIFSNFDKAVGIFGIGEDGHTAGILPMKDKQRFARLFLSKDFLSDYEIEEPSSSQEFKKRITITAAGIKKLNKIVLYAKGKSKKKVLENFLTTSSKLVNKTPALLLRQDLEKLEIFTDQKLSKKG